MNKLIGLVVASSVVFAQSAEITKMATWTGALNDPSAWVGGVVPGAEDVAVFDGDGGNYNLGGDMSWLGMVVTNAVAPLAILKDGFSLSLGAMGVKMGPDAKQSLTFYAPIILVENQSWFSGNLKTIAVHGTISGTGQLSVRNNPYYPTALYAFYGPVTTTGGLFANACEVHLRSNACVNASINVAMGKQLFLTDALGKRWSEVFPCRQVTNGGDICCGGFTYGLGAVTFEDGDSIVLADDVVGSSVENYGRLKVNGSTLNVTGGSIALNEIWANKGTLSQTGGTLSGAKDIVVGNGNDDYSMAVYSVTGGTASVGSSLALAMGENAFGTLKISGGAVQSESVRFGGTGSSASPSDGYGVLELTGGTLAVGAGGIYPLVGTWTKAGTFGARRPWYDIRLKGGVYEATASQMNAARMKIAGDVVMQTDDGVTAKQNAPLTGFGALTKTGNGTLALAAANTFTGAVTVAAGTLALAPSASPVAVFRADDLALSDGAAVTAWPSTGGAKTYSFTKDTTDAVGSQLGTTFTSPTFGASRMNGHAAVVFDGVKNALTMTGGSDDTDSTPAHGATELAVAVVFRASAAAGTSSDWRYCSGVVGSQMNYWDTFLNWGISVNAAGSTAAGVMKGDTSVAAWDSSKAVTDGQPHVAVLSWRRGRQVRVNVDGNRTSADETFMGALTKCRILLGYNESRQQFNGEIAEIRFYKGTIPSDTQEDAIGMELAATYGATYTANGTGTEEMPDASGVWAADTLTGTAGSPVSAWADTTGVAQFNSKIGDTVFGSSRTNPKISATDMNGHKAVAFNGKNDALAMTGGSTLEYVSGATNLSVAVVFRTTSAGVGGRDTGWGGVAGIIGQRYGTDGYYWGFGFTRIGQACGGVRNVAVGTTVYGTPRGLNDGQPHVAILTWGKNVAMTVDGYCESFSNTLENTARTATRMTLGTVEYGSYFCGDIAEIRFYKDIELSPSQRCALGKELAVKYGVETLGYLADETLFSLASKSMTVKSEATLVANGYSIANGQTFSGAGSVTGGLAVGDGGAIRSGTTEALSVDSLSLNDGAIIQAEFNGNGRTDAAIAVNKLTLGSGTITVDCRSNDAKFYPSGTILTWETDLTDNGAVWNVIGGSTASSVVVDTVNKRIMVGTARGMFVLLR